MWLLNRCGRSCSREFRNELFCRPLDLETQKAILYKLIEQKVGDYRFSSGGRSGSMAGQRPHFYSGRLQQSVWGAYVAPEVNRPFNSASLPWALTGRTPERGVFRYDPAGGCLVLE